MGGLELQRAYRNSYNGSRRNLLVASTMDLQVYVRKRKRNEVQVYVTIKPKGLSQIFEEGEEGDRRIRCLQHNPEKTKPRCSPKIDVAVEGRRSYKEVRSR